MSNPMKLGYGTYAMQKLDVYEALPRLRALGYEAIEIMGEEGWATAPDLMDRDDRKRLAGTIRDLGFDLSAVMALLPLCEEGAGRPALLERFRAICGLARDLWLDDGPAVLSSPPANPHPPWDGGRERIAASLLELADIAREHGVILAAEPHVGGALDAPEKAVWLMERTDHPALRINFDISHFHVQGMDLRHSVDLCLPHAAHIHVKDGYLDGDGNVVFQLPGEGSLDLGEYFRLVVAHRTDIAVTAEVSAMIWKLSRLRSLGRGGTLLRRPCGSEGLARLTSHDAVIRPIAREDLEDCARLFVEVFAEPPYRESWSVSSGATSTWTGSGGSTPSTACSRWKARR